jgi:hypothetical protein
MSKPARDKVDPDVNNGEDRGTKVVVIASIGIALPTLVVAARFYAKRITRAYFGWDDGLILAANAFCIALCAVGIGWFSVLSRRPHLPSRSPSLALY